MAASTTRNVAILTLAAVVVASPVGSLAARQSAPYEQGSLRGALALGSVGAYGERYILVGGSLTYFVLDGLGLRLDGDLWLGGEPSVSRLSPGLEYVFLIDDSFGPYAGAFFRHWFVGSATADLQTVGARGGLIFRRGSGTTFGIGIAAETQVQPACSRDCTFYYPELSLALAF